MNEVWAELLAAAKEEMKGGRHPGRCTNESDYDYGACELHVEMSNRRHDRLGAAILAAEAQSE